MGANAARHSMGPDTSDAGSLGAPGTHGWACTPDKCCNPTSFRTRSVRVQRDKWEVMEKDLEAHVRLSAATSLDSLQGRYLMASTAANKPGTMPLFDTRATFGFDTRGF
mmetsp:Transcript_106346/g.295900  ORF Transcript_106346/g.295900 Transcript_106346/m.295900 type:complete len:109 (+) Transcript_106346:45-371(+)|eukprot:CAMPEP_0179051292 /NCGR_PEP_ID=MMETSP0796-20121207/21171_1 /TAXON_ID=73915 /ORGANISM="Pyrodinium bahamense, Strain pbaha01" /LENGTH=108 /DNA_ID=CAMNT_0020747831 /DNA_START=44 /DNA_END=370 /DNA_ORIENTATION=+